MKIPNRLVVTALVTALALPCAAFGAKGDKKEKNDKSAAAFGKVDTDKDGSISQSEYVAAMKDKGGEDAAKSKFASLDKNGDGKLDKKEMAAAKADGEKRGRKKKNQE